MMTAVPFPDAVRRRWPIEEEIRLRDELGHLRPRPVGPGIRPEPCWVNRPKVEQATDHLTKWSAGFSGRVAALVSLQAGYR